MCHCHNQSFARLQKPGSLTATTCTTWTSWPCTWIARAAVRRSTSRPTCAASSLASTTPSSSPSSTSSAVDPSKVVMSTSRPGACRTVGVGSSALSYARSWSTSRQARTPGRGIEQLCTCSNNWQTALRRTVETSADKFICLTRDTNVTSSGNLSTAIPDV